MKRSIRVSHEGWFLFCPIYWSDEEETVIPRSWGSWWLFDRAIEVQQFRNWCLSWFDIEGGFPFELRPLVIPKVITYEED